MFHDTGGHTNVLKIPNKLGLPLATGGRTVPIDTLSLHVPVALIAGLDKLGIPVSHYVGVDLHMFSPTSSLGKLATGRLSVTGLISDPTGTTSLLEQVASHIYLGPGTPVSAVLSLMNVPTANPVSVPTAEDLNGKVVLASAFPSIFPRLPALTGGRGSETPVEVEGVGGRDLHRGDEPVRPRTAGDFMGTTAVLQGAGRPHQSGLSGRGNLHWLSCKYSGSPSPLKTWIRWLSSTTQYSGVAWHPSKDRQCPKVDSQTSNLSYARILWRGSLQIRTVISSASS